MNTQLKQGSNEMIGNITIIFSLSMSIKKWQTMGIFEKEMIIFSGYLRRGVAKTVTLFTYDSNDAELLKQAKKRGLVDQNISIVVAPKFAQYKAGAILYSLIAPILQRQHFTRTNAVYSHQSSGAWTGLIVKFLYGKRFVYRYGHSLWRRHLDRKQYHRLILSWPLDRLLTRYSDHALVSTKRDYSTAGRQNGITVCPNFIDTQYLQTLTSSHWAQRQNRAIYIGRLMPFKNLFNLIEACAAANLPLDIYGTGPLEQELKDFAKTKGGDCQFMGVVNNTEVRKALLDYQIFFLVSTYEGMPKSLLEGLASGCLCIVSPHYGCTEIITDKYNGLVCDDYSVQSIINTIGFARESNAFSIAAQGQQEILTRYSLDSVIDIHKAAYNGSLPTLETTNG